MNSKQESDVILETQELLTFMHQLWSEVDHLFEEVNQISQGDKRDFN